MIKNEHIVPYKMALELKKIGFNQPCLVTKNMNNGDGVVQIPLYQQVCDWLYEVSGEKLIIYYSPADTEELKIERFERIIETAKLWHKNNLLK